MYYSRSKILEKNIFSSKWGLFFSCDKKLKGGRTGNKSFLMSPVSEFCHSRGEAFVIMVTKSYSIFSLKIMLKDVCVCVCVCVCV